MKKILLISVLGAALNICNAQDKAALAQTPPMGWNSFNGYSCHIYEEVALKELDVFIETYAPKGYTYFVIDNGWFAEHQRIEAEGYRLPLQQHADPKEVRIDEYGIVQPSMEGFPNGFKPLVEKLHKNGLKFGVHLMRGIPQKAVSQNTRIKGTKYRARDIANTEGNCGWCAYMHGVDMSQPGAQEYYNSVIKQFADWGVDFIKVDDVIHKPSEIEAYRNAIDNCGRPMVLSLSPGRAANESNVEKSYTKATGIHPLSEEENLTKNMRSCIRVRCEHVFGRMSQMAMHRFRTIGLVRANQHTAISNLIYNMDRYAFLCR